jgi:hypothetical protein
VHTARDLHLRDRWWLVEGKTRSTSCLPASFEAPRADLAGEGKQEAGQLAWAPLACPLSPLTPVCVLAPPLPPTPVPQASWAPGAKARPLQEQPHLLAGWCPLCRAVVTPNCQLDHRLEGVAALAAGTLKMPAASIPAGRPTALAACERLAAGDSVLPAEGRGREVGASGTLSPRLHSLALHCGEGAAPASNLACAKNTLVCARAPPPPGPQTHTHT